MNPIFGVMNGLLHAIAPGPSPKSIRKRAVAAYQNQTQSILNKPGKFPNGKVAPVIGPQIKKRKLK